MPDRIAVRLSKEDLQGDGLKLFAELCERVPTLSCALLMFNADAPGERAVCLANAEYQQVVTAMLSWLMAEKGQATHDA